MHDDKNLRKEEAVSIEFQILDALQQIHTPVLTAAMKVITTLGNAGIIWIALAAVLLLIPKTRKTGIVVAIALILDLIICNGLLKNLVARTRPYDIHTAVKILIRKPADYSFPSGHTAAAFAATMGLYFTKDRDRKMWIPALILSVLIAFSRMYFYVHYPTDILGGIVIGVLCGYLGARFARKLKHL